MMYTYSAITYSRSVWFVAAMILGLRYFTNYSRINSFLRFSTFLLLVMFVLHVCVRFAVFVPPTTEYEGITELGGARGTHTIVPMLYLALISIGIGRLVNKIGFSLMSILMLLAGVAGIVLTESRSTYGALGVLAITSVIFVKSRVKMLVIYTLAGFIMVFAVGKMGYDFMGRFKSGGAGGGTVIVERFQMTGWRAMELKFIGADYAKKPWLILAGRGVGAMHPAPAGKAVEVGFYHSEYLGWLDKCGLVGLITVIVIMLTCLWRSFVLSRCQNKYLQYYGTTCFLLMMSLMAEGFFHPIFSHRRGASLLICFVAIMANWQDIYQSLCSEEEYLQDDNYQNSIIEYPDGELYLLK